MKIKSVLFLSLLLSIMIFQTSCSSDDEVTEPVDELPEGTVAIPPFEQQLGDAAAGYEYLIYGDYIDSGIPYQIYLALTGGGDPTNTLEREGSNALMPVGSNAVLAPNGEEVVIGSCYGCHAGTVNGTFVHGLGNNAANYTTDIAATYQFIRSQITDPAQLEAYDITHTSIQTAGSRLIMPTLGSNPAYRWMSILAAHRDRNDFSWKENAAMFIQEDNIPSDVPPWWLLKKKNSMYYAGNGRGNFSKILFNSMLQSVDNIEKADEIASHGDDVLAFIHTLEAPVFPGNIDQTLADQGELIFANNCAKCHGTYGDNETYPNLLVELEEIKTDPAVTTKNFALPEYNEWYNTSWFAADPLPSSFNFEVPGYIAPPLDGVWATAPYLHNGSVPTLEGVLDSSKRPTQWTRDATNPSAYDLDDKVGLVYTPTDGGGILTYNTTLVGHSNSGHDYGDYMTDANRTALIEYLKTL